VRGQLVVETVELLQDVSLGGEFELLSQGLKSVLSITHACFVRFRDQGGHCILPKSGVSDFLSVLINVIFLVDKTVQRPVGCLFHYFLYL